MRRKRYDSVPIGGETRSLKAWCQQTGVDPSVAYQRIHYLKWPPAQAVGLEPRVIENYGKKGKIRNHKNVRLTHNGVTHTLREWHEITLIPYTTLVYRYNQVPEWTSAEILDKEPNTPTVRRQRKMLFGASVWTEKEILPGEAPKDPPEWTPPDLIDAADEKV